MIEATRRAQILKTSEHGVAGIRAMSGNAFVLRLERNGLAFQPGQWVNLGRKGSLERREYTLYSSPSQDFLEVLVKEVEGGTVSRELRRCRERDRLEVSGPHGSFCIAPEALPGKFLFIGTGTGISPFHCFALSYPGLDYSLLHGARTPDELYDHDVFDPGRLVPCLSGPNRPAGAFAGRVTAWLRQNPAGPDVSCYLCGNSDMIYESYAILRGYGVPAARIFAEVYF